MAIRLTEQSGGRILEVRASGELAHEDYQHFVPKFEEMVRQHGKIRVLFEMADFHGWQAGALWDDIKFDLKHFSDIERLAMVGDRKWEKGMSVFCRPFTTAKIRYFDRAAIEQARAWIGGALRERAASPKGTGVEEPTEPPWRDRGSQRFTVPPWRAAAQGITGTGGPESPQTPVLRVFQTKEQTRAFYNKISGVYDLLAERSEGPVRRAGLELLKTRPGEKVLEIGCGTGHSLVRLAKSVGPRGKVFGLDLSDQMVKKARANLGKAGLRERVRLRCGDAVQMPYANSSVDAVFMSFTLELFDTPEIPQVLVECKRVLRPGGRIVVVGMSKDGQREPLLDVFEWAHQHLPDFVDCRPIFVREALEQAGFRIAKVLRQHRWVPVEIVLGTNE